MSAAGDAAGPGTHPGSSLAATAVRTRTAQRRRDWRQRSIATRLFISASMLSIVILLVAGLILTAVYRAATEEAFDERLGVYLRALVAELAADRSDDKAPEGRAGDGRGQDGGQQESRAPDIAPLSDPQFELTLSGWYWQITRLDSRLPEVRTSRSLFTAKLPRLAEAGVPADVGGARRGYAKGPDDRPLRLVERVIDTGDNGIYLVQVAATTSEIDAQMRQFEIDLAISFAVLAVALVVSSALQLRFGLQPLRQLQDGVSAIRRGEAERIEGVYPVDIAPLASELNLMVAANRDVVERARTQVGNLAHALKTPLSVIINEADSAGSDDAAAPFAAKVAEQGAIMRDQLAYYLERARAAVAARKIGTATDVAPVVAALVRTFEKITRERGLRFIEAGGEGVRFLGERQDLEEMIGNLVDNAGKWAAHEVAVTVGPEFRHPETERTFFRITIDDDGPGLAPEQRAAAMRRGERLDESKPGSGLGLSIVVELAELYGGAFRLDTSPASGLRAELTLPAS